MRLSVIFFLSIILASCASKEEKIESSVESAIENRLKEWLIERTNPQLSELEECIDEVPDWAKRCERALNCLKSDKFPECALPKASAVCTATSPGLYDVEISFRSLTALGFWVGVVLICEKRKSFFGTMGFGLCHQVDLTQAE